MSIILNELLSKIQLCRRDLSVTVGFDGYVDSIIKVRRENGKEEDTYFETMKSFGEYVAGKYQKSCSLELQLVREKSGGNMPIYAGALSKLAVGVNCIGAMGYPEVFPVFRDLEKGCVLYSISNPGSCQALEFDDGKLMLARNEEIEKLDFDLLTSRLPVAQLIKLADQSDMISFLNWSELKGSMSIWAGYAREVFPKLTAGRAKKLFIDLSDCSGRRHSEILEMTDYLRSFTRQMEVIISLNRNEAEKLAHCLDLPAEDTRDMALELQKELNCSLLIIHLVDGCCCADGSGLTEMKNKYVEKPKLLTGGGDNFNAGFTFACLNGLSTQESLIIANAVSGCYVTYGDSPTREQLINWLKENDCDRREESAV